MIAVISAVLDDRKSHGDNENITENITENLNSIPYYLTQQQTNHSLHCVQEIFKYFISISYDVLIPVEDYVSRWHKFLNLKHSVIVVALIYIHRITRNWTFLRVSSETVHRLLAASMWTAYKFLEDENYSTEYIAVVAGLSKKELVSLERHFLQLLKYDLFVSKEKFEEAEISFIMEALQSRVSKTVKATLVTENVLQYYLSPDLWRWI